MLLMLVIDIIPSFFLVQQNELGFDGVDFIGSRIQRGEWVSAGLYSKT